MATIPAALERWPRRGGAMIAALFQPRVTVPLVAGAVAAAELMVADRKYGVFTGGFGQFHAVDTLAERVLFLAVYGLSQVALVLLVWSVCAWASRAKGSAPAALNFAFLFGGGMLFALVSRYQLASYFSDAMDFALMADLGGGSLKDALLFSKNEIAMGVAALAGLFLAWWLTARLLCRVLPPQTAARPQWRRAGMASLGWLAALAIVPRLGEDEARGLERMIGWSTASQLAAAATDFDGDGYGLVGVSTDNHPFDGTRHPLALDVPGNGIDEDGYGGDLALVAVPQPRPETLVPAGAPNVVLVIMESTRREAIGKRIDGRLVAPNLTALAREGAAVRPTYSHVAFTTASLKSVFAGDLAPRAGAPSLFRELSKSGYRIGVFSGQAEDFGDISATVGMRSHADLFFDAETLREKRVFSFAAQGSLKVDEFVLLDEFDRHLGTPQQWRRPQFLYFNLQAAHFPYYHPGVDHRFAHPPVDRSQIDAAHQEQVERTYWNAVAYSDAALGALIARLKALGVWDDTILLVTGDHGEALFEDGFLGHGHVINERQFSTFVAVNRPLPGMHGPLAISDYRGLLLDLLTGRQPAPVTFKPFMHIGDLERPSNIGMAGTEFGLVTLRLDRGDACFERPAHCAAYASLAGPERDSIDGLVARWGSERWARQAPADRTR